MSERSELRVTVRCSPRAANRSLVPPSGRDAGPSITTGSCTSERPVRRSARGRSVRRGSGSSWRGGRRPRPRRARVQRPLGRGHEARPGRRDHRHLGPRPGPGLAAARADRRAGALRPRGWRRAHGPAALGAERARRPGARVPTAVHRRDGASGRRPPPVGAPRRPPAGPAGRHAGPQPAGARRPARPLGRPPAPDARGGDDGGGAGLGARGRPGRAGRPRRLAGRQRRGDARRRARRTGRR